MWLEHLLFGARFPTLDALAVCKQGVQVLFVLTVFLFYTAAAAVKPRMIFDNIERHKEVKKKKRLSLIIIIRVFSSCD